VKTVRIVPHGLCAGVNAAIARALELKDVYCLHELVHNEIVISDLKALGFRFVSSLEEVPEGATVVFSAHGVSPAVRELAKARRLKVVDTTCPFVARVHRHAREFAERGLPVVVLGDAGHVEVQGIVGEIEAVGGSTRKPRKGSRVAVVSQTTMNADVVKSRVRELERDYEVVAMAEVCNATKERQDAVREFCRTHPDSALLVLGSRTSANTKRLAEVAEDGGAKAFLAATVDEVRSLKDELERFSTVGVTSGASTPERFYMDAMKCLENVPQHVAIIMDGNGRWATKRGKKRGEGHIAGAKTLTKVVRWCGERKIDYVTVYAFSTENWKRSQEEVSGLMKLFALMMKTREASLMKNQVRFRVIGRRGDLPASLQKTIATLEKKTAKFKRQLIVCISYGGRAEIVDAVNAAIARGERVTEDTFRNFLYAPDVPDPDLVIRTSGEQRTSNFLLWESAYAEYHFTKTLWPDFSEKDLDAALADYAGRNRRKGGA